MENDNKIRINLQIQNALTEPKKKEENDNTIRINLKIQNALTEPKKKEENDKDRYWPLQEIKPQYGEWITDTVSNAKLITTVSKV